MTEENKKILSKRFRSLSWQVGTMVAALVVAFVADNLELVSMSGEVTVFLGLILSQITKILNSKAK